MPEPPRPILLGFHGRETLIECVGCRLRMRVPRYRRAYQGPRPRPAVLRKTFTFPSPEDRDFALRLEDRARLEQTTMSQLGRRLLRRGWEADPHLHTQSPSTPSSEATP
jgi:hypothetical protein